MKTPCAGQRISATIGKIPSGGERTGLLQNGSTDQNSSTPISLLLQTPLTSRCGGDLPKGFGTAAVTPRRLYRSVGALAPLRKVSSRFQNPAQNISVTPPHIDLGPRAQLYQALP